jgi:hypothetical protein
MKHTLKHTRSPEQLADELKVRQQHQEHPVRRPPASALNRQSFTALLNLLARFKTVRENQRLTVAEVADRMGIDEPILSQMESGNLLNPAIATLFRWAEVLGQKLQIDLGADA